MSPGCSRGHSPTFTSKFTSFPSRWTRQATRSPDLKDFIVARNVATESMVEPLSARTVSPTASSDRAAALPGTILAIRTWLYGAVSTVTPSRARRGKESEEDGSFAVSATEGWRERKTKKELAAIPCRMRERDKCMLVFSRGCAVESGERSF